MFENKLFSKSDIWALFLPLIAEQFLAYLVGLLDSVMVSSAGEAAVSAVSLVDSISVLMITIFSSLAAGGAVVIGQYLGMKNNAKARSAAEQLFVILGILSVAITAVLLIFKAQIIKLLFGSAESAVINNCNTYYHIVMFSIPFIALYNGGAALFRTLGNSRIPFRVSIIMNLINVVGNAILIYVFKIGVAGVAIPTLVSRAAAMVIILSLVLKKDFPLTLAHMSEYKYDAVISKNIFSIGIPNSIEGGMFQFGKIALLSLVSTLPTYSITANAIGNTVASLHCVIGMAANLTLISIASRCVGANDYDQARFYTRYMIKLTYILQGIFCVILILLIPATCKIYGVSGITATQATQILLLHAIPTILIWPLAFMLNTTMRAAGDSKFAMWIAMISMWVFRVSLSYILILGFKQSVVCIWICWSIDWLFRISVFLPRYLGHKWEDKAIE